MKEKNVRVRITHMSLSSSFVCARLWWRSQNGSSSKSARWGDILGPCKNKMCDFVLRSCMCFPFCELERDGKCICPKRRGCCCLLWTMPLWFIEWVQSSSDNRDHDVQVEIAIATPGRLIDFLGTGRASLFWAASRQRLWSSCFIGTVTVHFLSDLQYIFNMPGDTNLKRVTYLVLDEAWLHSCQKMLTLPLLNSRLTGCSTWALSLKWERYAPRPRTISCHFHCDAKPSRTPSVEKHHWPLFRQPGPPWSADVDVECYLAPKRSNLWTALPKTNLGYCGFRKEIRSRSILCNVIYIVS